MQCDEHMSASSLSGCTTSYWVWRVCACVGVRYECSVVNNSKCVVLDLLHILLDSVDTCVGGRVGYACETQNNDVSCSIKQDGLNSFHPNP